MPLDNVTSEICHCSLPAHGDASSHCQSCPLVSALVSSPVVVASSLGANQVAKLSFMLGSVTTLYIWQLVSAARGAERRDVCSVRLHEPCDDSNSSLCQFFAGSNRQDGLTIGPDINKGRRPTCYRPQGVLMTGDSQGREACTKHFQTLLGGRLLLGNRLTLRWLRHGAGAAVGAASQAGLRRSKRLASAGANACVQRLAGKAGLLTLDAVDTDCTQLLSCLLRA
eukprot:306833-Chlamydomonas_euryale.AAC.7